MNNWVLFLIFSCSFLVSKSQNLSYNDLRTILDYKDYQIDTFLVKRNYKASPKEQEGDTYYFRWTHRADTLNTIQYHYVSVVDVYQKNTRVRLFRYGTIDSDEMVDMVDALKEDGYVQKQKFEFTNQIHVYYEKGKEKVVMKYIYLDKVRDIDTVYEFEFGN